MPSAWLISVPRASAMKQEKSWLWLKIGERAVRVITQPIWCEMWSSRFCTSASVTGSEPPALSEVEAGHARRLRYAPGSRRADRPRARSRGPTKAVVVRSSISSGPSSVQPGRSSAPS